MLVATTVHLWERGSAMATRIVWVPIPGSIDGPTTEHQSSGPWSRRIFAALDASSPSLGIVDARLPPGYSFAVAPDGALGSMEPLFLDN